MPNHDEDERKAKLAERMKKLGVGVGVSPSVLRDVKLKGKESPAAQDQPPPLPKTPPPPLPTTKVEKKPPPMPTTPPPGSPKVEAKEAHRPAPPRPPVVERPPSPKPQKPLPTLSAGPTASPPPIPARPKNPGQDQVESAFSLINLRVETLEKSLIDYLATNKKLDSSANAMLVTCKKLKAELKENIAAYHKSGPIKKSLDLITLQIGVDKAASEFEAKIQGLVSQSPVEAKRSSFSSAISSMFGSEKDSGVIKIIADMRADSPKVKSMKERLAHSLEQINLKPGHKNRMGGPS